MVADLKSGSLAGAVQKVAADAVGAGKESVQTHFADGGDKASPQKNG